MNFIFYPILNITVTNIEKGIYEKKEIYISENKQRLSSLLTFHLKSIINEELQFLIIYISQQFDYKKYTINSPFKYSEDSYDFILYC